MVIKSDKPIYELVEKHLKLNPNQWTEKATSNHAHQVITLTFYLKAANTATPKTLKKSEPDLSALKDRTRQSR